MALFRTFEIWILDLFRIYHSVNSSQLTVFSSLIFNLTSYFYCELQTDTCQLKSI